MQPDLNFRPHVPRRILPWLGIFLLLSALSAGAALADERGGSFAYASHGKYRGHGSHYRHDDHGDSHRYGSHDRRHSYCDRRDHGHYGHDRYDRYDRHRRYDQGHRYRSHVFDIPRQILRDLAHHYRSYYYGRVYHSGHHHHHEVYRFPVYGDHGVGYYPYAYCQGDYYARGRFGSRGPIFD